MRVDVANLSELLDAAAPGRRLATAIRAQQTRIDQELATKKFSLIEVNGTKYKITKAAMPSSVTGLGRREQ